MQILNGSHKKHYVILCTILVLSGYIHLWNPVGFPDIFFDEGIYMRRAMNVLDTGNPQESYFYDHPYFGQIILAGFLKIVGFPDTVEKSLEMSYLLPRVLMGLFAILDTFLIYKITEKKFGKKTAILASILFAVMPFTWLLRRILLDNILLPFMLSSILLTLYSKNSKHRDVLIMSSVVLMGLAIFTKITAVTMIPLLGYLIYTNTKAKINLVKFMPITFIIPLMWPIISIYHDQYNYWSDGVLWQAGRHMSGGFAVITANNFNIDPVFMGLGLISIVYAAIRKNYFLLFWMIPFLLFINIIGYVQYFHYILILPVMCISGAFMIQDLIKRINYKKFQRYVYFGASCMIIAFGLVISSILITQDLSGAQFEMIIHVNETINDENTTLLASPIYTWIFSDVYDKKNVFADYSDVLYYPVMTDNYMMISDNHLLIDLNRGGKLQKAYDESDTVFHLEGNVDNFNTEKFPYGSMIFTREGSNLELKAGSRHLLYDDMN